MFYLVQTFAIPLLVALAGGLAVGWVTSDREDKGPSGWAALAMTVFVLMAVAATLKWVPGRPGLWLDTAVLFGAAYLLGCVVGAFARVFTDKVEEMATEPLEQLAGAGQAFTSTVDAVKAVSGATQSVARVVGEAAERRLEAQAAATSPPAAPEQKATSGAAAAAEAMAQGTKPHGLAAPRGGAADELELIRGIGPQNEARLHALGVFHFDQIAAWTAKEAQWVGGYLAFPGRIEREDWIGQARILAAGGTTDHAERVRKGEISSTPDGKPTSA
jgi:predicted flap endonuclease-1-like 5' DNA nuclease